MDPDELEDDEEVVEVSGQPKEENREKVKTTQYDEYATFFYLFGRFFPALLLIFSFVLMTWVWGRVGSGFFITIISVCYFKSFCDYMSI